MTYGGEEAGTFLNLNFRVATHIIATAVWCMVVGFGGRVEAVFPVTHPTRSWSVTVSSFGQLTVV